MLAGTRKALLLACVVALPCRVEAQHSPDTSRINVSAHVAGGMMKYGPVVNLGATLGSPNARIGARLDLMAGVAPDNRVPGSNFMSASAAAVLPVLPGRRVAPYLLAGAAVSQSRYLPTAVSPLAGTGVRFELGSLRPYAEARVQQRSGLSMLLGLTF